MIMETYEEKYKDLIARLQKAKENDDVCDERFCCVIDEIAPELVESEDEQIRKEIEQLIQCMHDADPRKERWIAWLEKQGEQKPADKVEPKFHEGEWITNGDYIWKIVEVKPLDYILQSQNGNIVDDTISHVNEQFHSFTIDDAKDGDVLADKYNNIGIYQDDKNAVTWNSYCYCGVNKRFYSEGCHEFPCYPATKEQRDTLMKAIVDAGYTFDFDKKELKKIEKKSQRMVSAEAKEALYDKPTDEEMKELLRTEYEKGRADVITEIGKKKSFKQRMRWEPSENQMKQLKKMITAIPPGEVHDGLESLYNDLKKLTE